MTKGVVHVVGAGITGATVARRCADVGFKVYVYEAKPTVGGLCEDTDMGIQYYGPHIFHTDNEVVMNFLNRFTSFIPVKYIVGLITDFGNFDFPFSLEDAQKIDSNFNVNQFYKEYPEDLSYEDYMLAKTGEKLYHLTYKPYSERFWGCSATHLSQMLGKRVSLREPHECYHKNKYAGMPVGGFKQMIERMLDHSNISVIHKRVTASTLLSTPSLGRSKVFSTAHIDEFFEYKYGELEYVRLDIKIEEETEEYHKIFTDKGIYSVCHTYNTPRSNASLCYRSSSLHRYYDNPNPCVVKEYVNNVSGLKTHPLLWGINASHPLYDDLVARMQQYTKYANRFPNLVCCGRFGNYKYMDMDKCVEEALKITANI